jgi:hypothetical protein
MAALPPPPPRLQGRLTAELVLGSPQGFNAVKDYELDLRGARNTRQRTPACCSPVPTCRMAVEAPQLARRRPLPPANPKSRPIRPRAQATSWAPSKTWRSARCVSGPLRSAGSRPGVALTASLGAQNQFDCIDLSDNEIVKLEGFPPLKRLSTLLAHNNRITRIGPGLAGAPRRSISGQGSRPALPRCR